MYLIFLALMGIVCLSGCGSDSTAARTGNGEMGGTSSTGSGGYDQSGGNVQAGGNSTGGSATSGGGGETAMGAGGSNTAGSAGSTMAADSGADGAPIDASTLKGTGKLIGTALSSGHLNDTMYANVAGTEFAYVTPENEMKWDSTEPTQNQFRFTGGDQIVQFAEAHGMKVKGHTLVWHSQLPSWMQSMTGADTVRAAMTNHITKVMQHFKGHVIAWDVVNEAMDGTMQRSDVFQQQIGSGYIADAFRAAHDADGDALLFYNDYGAEGLGGKSDAVFNMVKGLVNAGVPINGVGFQMHIGVQGWPPTADVAANMKRYVDLGLKVNISEMDVSLCNGTGTDPLMTQQTRYHDIIKACLDSTICHAITLWGVTDKYSWLNSQMACSMQNVTPRGLAFDDTYQKKPAYTGILNALLGK
jgi:endo-1,4-beta-xylanase